MFSSKTDQWATPQDFFNKLNDEFNFTLDPCADEFNHKCDKYYTKEDDGLSKSWGGETVFCNPPYGREISKWVHKCFIESHRPNTTCVMLIPARTDTKWFHDYIYNFPFTEIRFIKGRLKFGDSKNSAPFPSMVVIFRPHNKRNVESLNVNEMIQFAELEFRKGNLLSIMERAIILSFIYRFIRDKLKVDPTETMGDLLTELETR